MTTQKSRVWELDALRGLALLGMIGIHLVYDLVDLFGVWNCGIEVKSYSSVKSLAMTETRIVSASWSLMETPNLMSMALPACSMMRLTHSWAS